MSRLTPSISQSCTISPWPMTYQLVSRQIPCMTDYTGLDLGLLQKSSLFYGVLHMIFHRAGNMIHIFIELFISWQELEATTQVSASATFFCCHVSDNLHSFAYTFISLLHVFKNRLGFHEEVTDTWLHSWFQMIKIGHVYKKAVELPRF